MRCAEQCVTWPGRLHSNGYGVFSMKGREVYAHRWTWEQSNGPIPPGMVVMHICDNPPCVLLDHLRLGTQAENLADMRAKRRNREGHGRGGQHGEKHHNAKLTEKQVREIRASSEGRPLARRLGISYSTVKRVRRGGGWR